MSLKWWGYLHSNGSFQVKRYFGDWDDILKDIKGNDLVVRVVGTFNAESREEAVRIILKSLKHKEL